MNGSLNRKRKFQTESEDFEDGPGKDYYFDMINLRKFYDSEELT